MATVVGNQDQEGQNAKRDETMHEGERGGVVNGNDNGTEKPSIKPSKTYKGVAMPAFFKEESAQKFQNMNVKPNDVFLVSLVKGGTTWVNKLLFTLLHGFDDDGNVVPGSQDLPNAQSQTYPSALFSSKEALEEAKKNMQEGSTDDMIMKFFGCYSVDDLLNQPEPRLFSTHLFGERFLPNSLFESDNGKVVIVVRNLKDVLVSLHHFRGVPKDDWLGNEHGPGSYARYIDLETPNAFGSTFKWLKEMDDVAKKLDPSGRVCVVYYEALKNNLPAQLDRIAEFVGLGILPLAKRQAVLKAIGFDAMKKNKNLTMLMRKGVIGDWKNYLSAEHWKEFDEIFDRECGGTSLAWPLYHFQYDRVRGLPPIRSADQPIDGDPRTWESFKRVTLVNGMVVPDALIQASKQGGPFIRPPSELKGTIVPCDHPEAVFSKFVAEPGRYHLFVSGVCPWATSVLFARNLLGLEDVISADIADAQSGSGWVFLDGVSCEPWKDREGSFYLHECYQVHDALITSRLTVPVLWDTKTRQIVSNDSWGLIETFSTAFKEFHKIKHKCPINNIKGLWPTALEKDMNTKHKEISHKLLNGVYRAGIPLIKNNLDAAQSAAKDVYGMLQVLDTELASKRFLFGPNITAIDLRLTANLLRFDVAYYDAFALRGGKGHILLGSSYPNLKGYLRDMYQYVKPGVFWATYYQYYRWNVGLPKEKPLPKLEPIIESAEAAPDHNRTAL